jgi:hypothetical protein
VPAHHLALRVWCHSAASHGTNMIIGRAGQLSYPAPPRGRRQYRRPKHGPQGGGTPEHCRVAASLAHSSAIVRRRLARKGPMMPPGRHASNRSKCALRIDKGRDRRSPASSARRRRRRAALRRCAQWGEAQDAGCRSPVRRRRFFNRLYPRAPRIRPRDGVGLRESLAARDRSARPYGNGRCRRREAWR